MTRANCEKLIYEKKPEGMRFMKSLEKNLAVRGNSKGKGRHCPGVARMAGAGRKWESQKNRKQGQGPAGGRQLCSLWNMLAGFEQESDMIRLNFIRSL